MAVYIEVYASFGAFNFKIALSVPCGTRRFSSTQTHTPEFCDPQKYLIKFLQLFLLRKKPVCCLLLTGARGAWLRQRSCQRFKLSGGARAAGDA